jgi:hypothetical protein
MSEASPILEGLERQRTAIPQAIRTTQDYWQASVERYFMLVALPVFLAGQIVFYLLPAYLPLNVIPVTTMQSARTWLLLIAAIIFALIGRRACHHFWIAIAERKYWKIVLFGLVSLVFFLLMSIGQVHEALPTMVISSRLSQWLTPLILLSMAAASIPVIKWYAKGAAIFREASPTEVKLSIEKVRTYELLQSELEKSAEQLKALQLIRVPEKDISTLIAQNICIICGQGAIKDIKHSACKECKLRYQNVINQINRQRNRAREKGLEATLILYEWLRKLDHYNNRCSICQSGPAQVIEHYIPISKGGGTTTENCDPACIPCNVEKSHRRPKER